MSREKFEYSHKFLSWTWLCHLKQACVYLHNRALSGYLFNKLTNVDKDQINGVSKGDHLKTAKKMEKFSDYTQHKNNGYLILLSKF